MRVLVLSLYDLGRPPLEALALAEKLRNTVDHDYHAEVVDLAVESWPTDRVAAADVIVLPVPMHTAARMAVEAAARVRAEGSVARIACFGLYAHLAGGGLDDAVDASFGPQHVEAIIEWLAEQPARMAVPSVLVDVADVSSLPHVALDRYSQLAIGSERRVAGALSSSSGCLHRCTHCPVPVAFDGRIRLSTVDSVLASATAQIAAGAEHLSFVDPDFLNAPSHARRVVSALRNAHPTVTFDCTVKVEHILRHAEIWPEFAAAGCLFVVSALESVDDEVLRILDKGHTAAEGERAANFLRSAGIEIRPSLLPFTPWTTVQGIAELFAFADRCDLIDSIDPVQFSIRLLVPQGSLLANHAEMLPYRGTYDSAAMTYQWISAHAGVDDLQIRLATIAEDGASRGEPSRRTFASMRAAVVDALGPGQTILAASIGFGSVEARPKMTEPWFC